MQQQRQEEEEESFDALMVPSSVGGSEATGHRGRYFTHCCNVNRSSASPRLLPASSGLIWEQPDEVPCPPILMGL